MALRLAASLALLWPCCVAQFVAQNYAGNFFQITQGNLTGGTYNLSGPGSGAGPGQAIVFWDVLPANSIMMTYTLAGLDPLCTSTAPEATSANFSCVVKVTNGTCTSTGFTLGYDYFSGTNNWPLSQYEYLGSVSSYFTPAVAIGYSATSLGGKIVVLYDSTGIPYACATIVANGAYTYAESWTPTSLNGGGVIISNNPAASNFLLVSWIFPSFSDSSCTQANAASSGNASVNCSVQVLSGTCAAPGVAQYGSTAYNLWNSVDWSTTTPTTQLSGSIQTSSTLLASSFQSNNIVVFYNYSSQIVACAPLSGYTPPTPAPTAAPAPAPTPATTPAPGGNNTTTPVPSGNGTTTPAPSGTTKGSGTINDAFRQGFAVAVLFALGVAAS